MGFKVLTTSGATKQTGGSGVSGTADLTNVTGVLAIANGGTASALGVGLVKTVVKAADETVTSSSTLQDDDTLVLPVVATSVYVVELVLWTTSGASATPDIKIAWTLPTGATLSTVLILLSSVGSTPDIGFRYQNTTPTTAQPANVAANTNSGLRLTGLLRVGANAGNLQLQWAQNTSDGTGTVVKADSYLSLTRVS